MGSRTVAAVGACVIAIIAPAGAGASSVVFTDYESIYAVGADGTGLRTITHKNASHIAVSPNGRQLAYTHGSLYTMKLTGRKHTTKDLLRKYPIVRNFGGAYSPSWSPSGKQIVFVGANDGRLYVVKSNGKDLRYLLGKNRVVGTGYPIWSPDGREIFFSDGADGSDLKAVDLKSGAERVIYPGDGAAGTAADFDVSPDGRRIAFYAPYRNWMINTDGTGLRQISPPGAYFESYDALSFSPDGDELAGRFDGEIWALDGEFGADTGSGGYRRMLTADLPGSAFDTDWIP